MALRKAATALLIAALVVAASAATHSGDPSICYCPCMQDQCMTLEGTTKEECAAACDRGCRESGYVGQPNPYEFCGF